MAFFKQKKVEKKEITFNDVLTFCKEKGETKPHMKVCFATEICSALGISPNKCDTIKANLITQELFNKERT